MLGNRIWGDRAPTTAHLFEGRDTHDDPTDHRNRAQGGLEGSLASLPRLRPGVHHLLERAADHTLHLLPLRRVLERRRRPCGTAFIGRPHLFTTYTMTFMEPHFRERYRRYTWSAMFLPVIVVTLAVVNLTLLVTIFF